MSALFHTPARRIALAVALSVLAHMLALWLPQVSLPVHELPLPPLAAKLEPLPRIAISRHRKPAPRQKTEPVVPAPFPDAEAASAVAAIPGAEAASAVAPAAVVEATSAVETSPEPAAQEEVHPAHPLPRHARLTFMVYNGQSHFQIGTIQQELETGEGSYTLKATTQTVGIARMFKNYQLTQSSRGKIGKQGLVPNTFEEEKFNDGAKENVKATFDWTTRKILFSHGGSAELPDGAQDMLSIFYNLSQHPFTSDVISLAVSNGKKLEQYEFEINPDAEITTPLGKLKTVHLRKLHAKGESGFEIWLGLEYRLLPVKYRLVEPSGEVSGEIEISDIRVADE